MGEEEAAALAADMTRLGARPYAEVGVPMFLVAEDLRGGAMPRGDGEPGLAATLAVMVAERPDPAEAVRLVEVLADRCMLAANGPTFTRLSAGQER